MRGRPFPAPAVSSRTAVAAAPLPGAALTLTGTLALAATLVLAATLTCAASPSAAARAPFAAGQPAAAQGGPPVEVTGASYAEYDRAAGTWLLRGFPVVVAWGPARLEAPEVRYDERRGLVEASGGVVLRQETLVLRASRTAAWLRSNLVVAEEGVEVTAQRGADLVRLTAGRIEVDLARRRVMAEGSPLLTFGQMRLAGRRLEFDAAAEVGTAAGDADLTLPEGRLQAGRVEARLAEERATAVDDVRLTAGELLARAPLAVADGRAGVVTLSGGVVVRRGSHTLTAEVVRVELRARRVTATGGPRLTLGGPGQ
ncbi:MAG: hypothetical protein QN152_02655 [Armatimonadota bacterium]|nr:hypothetical protein [Armatimonadota bacterium]MDR7426447.1 hypothetical protein [Armatimonadota bacterium]MDR7464684.1 hypothetical protein [Armatimonadota bacterium]MDR7473414.1 hypothetical protein [Armatimonadota bacterium]MDR7538417.1 hypothetical protein [Armatimonadota bacterium]